MRQKKGIEMASSAVVPMYTWPNMGDSYVLVFSRNPPKLRVALRTVLLQHEQVYLFITPPLNSLYIISLERNRNGIRLCRETEPVCIITN